MKARFVEDQKIVITPETDQESYALQHWASLLGADWQDNVAIHLGLCDENGRKWDTK